VEECFGEAWMKGQNQGAVAYIGNATQTFLNFGILEGTGNEDPFNGFDPVETGLFDAMMNPEFQTLGQIVTEVRKSCERADVMDEAYKNRHIFSITLLGDPSLTPQFGLPTTQEVEYDLIPGESSLFIINAVPYAYFALRDDNGTIIGSGITGSDGGALLELDQYQSEQLDLVVTAKNKIPYFETIQLTGTVADQVPGSELNLLIYPNPFNPSTRISFNLNSELSDIAELGIYNIKGQKVKSFDSSLRQGDAGQAAQDDSKGNYSVVWNGKDDDDQPVSSGVYYCRLISGNSIATRKLVLIK
jgi:peptidase C25-like protein